MSGSNAQQTERWRRVDLNGPLAGSYVMVDDDRLTFGLLEDFQSQKVGLILDALAQLIVDGSLPHGTSREGLRALTISQAKEITDRVLESPALGNGS